MTTYKESGVDIAAGDEAVKNIKKYVKKTFNSNVLTDIGGFGGAFEFPVKDYNKPVLISSAKPPFPLVIILSFIKRQGPL